MFRKLKGLAVAIALVCWMAPAAQAGVIDLIEYGYNIDGTISEPLLGDPVPGVVDDSGFDDLTGLGRITVGIGGTGVHNVLLYVNHDIDDAINTFFNEFGAFTGMPGVTLSWEIDEPGFVFGDIFDNFLSNTLDNTNGVPAAAPDDVAMALGFDFTLAQGEFMTVIFDISEVMPTSGFVLSQTDPDSDQTIYFTATIQAPEPASGLLFVFGLLGVVAFHRKFS